MEGEEDPETEGAIMSSRARFDEILSMVNDLGVSLIRRRGCEPEDLKLLDEIVNRIRELRDAKA